MMSSQLQRIYASAAAPSSRMYVLAIVAALFVAFLDTAEVALALVGAFGYLLVRQASVKLPAKPASSVKKIPVDVPVEKADKVEQVSTQPRQSLREAPPVRQERKPHSAVVSTPTPELRQLSVCPVVCPSFASADWDGQISELLLKLAPSDETAGLVHAITDRVQSALRSSFPDAAVVGFAHGNPKSSKAFAVAVPDVEIVLNVTPAEMIRCLGSQFSAVDAKCLQKAVIRAATDSLAYGGDFKFRRSAFKYDEPKVTLLAPPTLDAIPFHFSVNAKEPSHHDTLLNDGAKADMRVFELVLLVHRWARDRGISHVAKGHLSPYAWTLVVLFFAQVRTEADGPLIPALRGSSPYFAREGKQSKKSRLTPECPKTSVATLFKEFVDFYAIKFDWRHEVLSIGHGCRNAPAKDALEWRRQGGLQICDPFEPSTNLASLLSKDGLVRLGEEFGRAAGICSKNGLLSHLLEPWVPPESADGPIIKQSAEAVRATELPSAKASMKGSLTASPMEFSLRPSAKPVGGKISLTASPVGLSFRPGGKVTPAVDNKSVLTAAPGLSLRPGAAKSRECSSESGGTGSGDSSIPTSSSDTD